MENVSSIARRHLECRGIEILKKFVKEQTFCSVDAPQIKKYTHLLCAYLDACFTFGIWVKNTKSVKNNFSNKSMKLKKNCEDMLIGYSN